jgi:hypothetical protein
MIEHIKRKQNLRRMQRGCRRCSGKVEGQKGGVASSTSSIAITASRRINKRGGNAKSIAWTRCVTGTNADSWAKHAHALDIISTKTTALLLISALTSPPSTMNCAMRSPAWQYD